MVNVYFNPELTDAKQRELDYLYTAIDFLIVTTPPESNPMTNDGFNFWDWGLITVDGIELPAPYKEVGYNWDNEEIELEPEYSAAVNLLIWLEALHAYAKSDVSKDEFMLAQCSGAFNWILSLDPTELSSIMSKLREKCNESTAARRVID